MPTPPQGASVPVRSAGASDVLQDLPPAVAALAGSGLVADLTVEGLLHAPELHTILKGGARVLIISNENPDALERLAPDEGLKDRVRAALARTAFSQGSGAYVSKPVGGYIYIYIYILYIYILYIYILYIYMYKQIDKYMIK